MRTLFFLTVLSLSSSAFAERSINSQIDDRGIINLRTAAASLSYRYNYPGMDSGGTDSPDCLTLVTNGARVGGLSESDLELFASEIVVTDGGGILSRNQNGVNILPARIGVASLQYGLVDLSKFVTGIRIETKSGQSLNQVVRNIIGKDPQNFVGFQLLRGCKY